jgi:hypothetical protein
MIVQATAMSMIILDHRNIHDQLNHRDVHDRALSCLIIFMPIIILNNRYVHDLA